MSGGAYEFFPAASIFDLNRFAERCGRMREAAPGRPFALPVLSFLGSLSARLLGDSIRRKHPQLAALGFWIRPTVLARLAYRYQSRAEEDGAVLVPRGLVFHLPPTNVDVMFAYSWFLSLLAGNANLIRLPRSINPAAQLLLDAVAREAECIPAVRDSSLIIHYPHSADSNQAMSSECNVRAVWGGDAKVHALRMVPLPLRAIQIEFTDRFSYAAFKAEAYLALTGDERTTIGERFFNDVFWFDQMGCASPRLLFWVGDEAISRSIADDFFARLLRVVGERGYAVDASTAVAKLNYADRFVLDLPVESVRRLSNELTVLTLTEPVDFRAHVMGAGTLAQIFVSSPADIAHFVEPRDQTLVQFGFDRREIQDLLAMTRGRGLDRIVSVGRALDFHYLWDGFDLVSNFCRLVHIG